MKLNDLRPYPGSKKKRKRVGRGISAGQGKTAGRGTKGQGARSGGGKGPYFEGGQLPLVRRLPFKRGFTNIHKITYKPVNVGSLDTFKSGTEVDPEILVAEGLLKKASDPVVILGNGDVSVKLNVKAHRVSSSAKRKIEAAGGTVILIPLS
ncbi:MAG TPA: 50S ribosomal protein L15 [Patescibacteria group bacterium]|jgi:large subunit ribosomal protein L15|nr:50S ribosomal protein L15 [Patescibacteria group bacterium]